MAVSSDEAGAACEISSLRQFLERRHLRLSGIGGDVDRPLAHGDLLFGIGARRAEMK